MKLSSKVTLSMCAMTVLSLSNCGFFEKDINNKAEIDKVEAGLSAKDAELEDRSDEIEDEAKTRDEQQANDSKKRDEDLANDLAAGDTKNSNEVTNEANARSASDASIVSASIERDEKQKAAIALANQTIQANKVAIVAQVEQLTKDTNDMYFALDGRITVEIADTKAELIAAQKKAIAASKKEIITAQNDAIAQVKGEIQGALDAIAGVKETVKANKEAADSAAEASDAEIAANKALIESSTAANQELAESALAKATANAEEAAAIKTSLTAVSTQVTTLETGLLKANESLLKTQEAVVSISNIVKESVVATDKEDLRKEMIQKVQKVIELAAPKLSEDDLAKLIEAKDALVGAVSASKDELDRIWNKLVIPGSLKVSNSLVASEAKLAANKSIPVSTVVELAESESEAVSDLEESLASSED